MFLNGFCLTETAYHQLRTAIAAANWRGRDVAFAVVGLAEMQSLALGHVGALLGYRTFH